MYYSIEYSFICLIFCQSGSCCCIYGCSFLVFFILNVYKIKAYTESEACDSASVVPIHTRSEVSSDSDSASVASVNQP